MPPKRTGGTKIQPVLEPLPADGFYAGVKKKSRPTRKKLAERLRAPPKRVKNPYRLYTISYKLRVLSYWKTASIPTSPTQLRKPTHSEVATRFKIPKTNLYRWKKEEEEGKYKDLTRSQYRVTRGGRKRKWMVMERELYDQFQVRRAGGGFVRRGWFRRVSKEIFQST